MAIEALGESWWTAFAAAEGALDAAAGTLPPAELRDAARRLAREREQTVALLDAVARTDHDTHRFAHLLAGRTSLRRLLGLPQLVGACVFNLDGVLIGSAAVHAAAWHDALDPFLLARRDPFERDYPFDPDREYFAYLHGKPRLEGLRAFLASRGISLPEPQVRALADAKRDALLRRLERHGVRAFDGSHHYLELVREAGIRRAVVSASANAPAMLEQAGLERLVDVDVDGTAMVAEHLRPKPAPDALLAACARLDVPPERAAAFETTPAGIAAARAAGFALVVAVDMPQDGADVAVPGLAELLERAVGRQAPAGAAKAVSSIRSASA